MVLCWIVETVTLLNTLCLEEGRSGSCGALNQSAEPISAVQCSAEQYSSVNVQSRVVQCYTLAAV